MSLFAPSAGGVPGAFAAPGATTPATSRPDSTSRTTIEQAALRAGLRTEVLDEALVALRHALDAGAATRDSILTVIDYSRPSYERRLWVLDLARGRVLAHEFVAHGRGSGNDLATRFSNRPGSYATSLGTFVTSGTYDGSHGRSLRLRGLDRGLNDNAMARALVVHGAWYVSEDLIRRQGRLGRSEGCPALAPDVAPRIIDLIAGGSVLFSYYPSPALQAALSQSQAAPIAPVTGAVPRAPARAAEAPPSRSARARAGTGRRSAS